MMVIVGTMIVPMAVIVTQSTDHRNNIDRSVTHAGFGGDRVGVGSHILRAALKNDHLHTIVMIQVNMKSGQNQIVATVSGIGETSRKFALMMVVNIG